MSSFSIAAYTSANLTLTGAGEPERISGAITTADLFPLLGVQPLAGRAFSTEEDRPGQGQVVMLSHSLWRRRFASKPDIVGQSVTLNGQPHTIVGVMPAGFQFPSAATEIWKPMAFTTGQLSENERGSHYLSVIARLRTGLTRQQAQTEIAAITQQMQQRHPTFYEANSGWGATVVSRHEEEVGEVSLVLWVLFGAVGCVALIACVNVANLLLARAATRQREMAVRAALGAGRWRIVRQLLTESLLLALVGGSLGMALAALGNRLLIALGPADLPRLDEVGLDARALVFTAALSLLTGILFGLAPAWQAWRLNLSESLKAGGKVTEGHARQRLRGLLVAGEIAVAFDEGDRENTTRVALINETLAHIFFAGENPLGKRLKLGGADSPFPWLSIAGVIRDVKHGGLDTETQPEMYAPYLQPLLPNWSVPPMFLAVRAESNPASLIAAVRGVAQELDREQPVYSIATMEQLLAKSIAPRQFNMRLLAAFAALALLLAAVGVYGVTAYAVNQRTHEIGVRLALGAQTRAVQWLIIRQGMALVALGVGLGLAGALALTRLLEKLLFSVEPTDPLTFALVPLLLIGVALAACYLPARRATQVDPMALLRHE